MRFAIARTGLVRATPWLLTGACQTPLRYRLCLAPATCWSRSSSPVKTATARRMAPRQRLTGKALSIADCCGQEARAAAQSRCEKLEIEDRVTQG